MRSSLPLVSRLVSCNIWSERGAVPPLSSHQVGFDSSSFQILGWNIICILYGSISFSESFNLYFFCMLDLSGTSIINLLFSVFVCLFYNLLSIGRSLTRTHYKMWGMWFKYGQVGQSKLKNQSLDMILRLVTIKWDKSRQLPLQKCQKNFVCSGMTLKGM